MNIPPKYAKDPATAKAYSDAFFNYRSLSEIAKQIQRLWKRPARGAKPYLDAMLHLRNMHADSAADVVSHFLSNAQTWRGPMARQIKAELHGLLDKETH